MSKHNNRSSRKSQSLRSSNKSNIKQNTDSAAEADLFDEAASAIGESASNDMSWAEEYADDSWSSSDISSESTRVVIPKRRSDSPADLESTGTVNVENTLTFKRASAASSLDDNQKDLAAEEANAQNSAQGQVDITEDKASEEQPEAAGENVSEQSGLTENQDADIDNDWDGEFKIRDAVTDKTIVSLSEAQTVRRAALKLQMDDDWTADEKIRDAVTDKTIVSLNEAQTVRNAASQLQMDDDWMADAKIRDAVTDKTIVSLNEAQTVRNAASQLQMDADWMADAKIRDAATDKTIVSLGEAQAVRSAASQLQMDADWMADAKIRDAATDKTIVSLEEVQAVRNAAADDDASLTRVFKISKPKDAENTEESAKTEVPKKKKNVGSLPSKESEKMQTEKASEVRNRTSQDEQRSSTRRTQANDSIYGNQRKLYSDKDRISEKVARSSYAETEKRPNRNTDYDRGRHEARRSSRTNSYDEQGRYDRDRRQSRPVRYDYDERPVRRQRNSYDDYDYRRRSRNAEAYYYKEAKSPLRFIPLVLVIAICVLGFMAARQIAYDVPVNSADYSKYNYTITADATNESVANDLLNLGLIDNALIYRIRCIFYSADYKEGTYVLSPCYSTEKIINILSGYEYGSD